jgi:hypothetical protein
MREVIPKGIANPGISVTQPQKWTSLFSSILRTCSDMFKEEEVENQKLHQVPVPTHLRSMNLKTVQGDMAKPLSDVQSEISFGQIAVPE